MVRMTKMPYLMVEIRIQTNGWLYIFHNALNDSSFYSCCTLNELLIPFASYLGKKNTFFFFIWFPSFLYA